MLVAQLQTVVSREVRPTHPAVVTVGAIQGGTTYNIIPDTCLIKGTVRTLHAEARDIAEAAIKRLAAGMLEGMRVACEVDYRRGVPLAAQRRSRAGTGGRRGAQPVRRRGRASSSPVSAARTLP